MKKIKSIDLWTEQYKNHYECFNGAFIDGIENNKLLYDCYKVIKNCNCLISNNKNIAIGNKHHAIVFYKNLKPIRLMVICKDTDINKLLNNALNQEINDIKLKQIIKNNNVTQINVNLKETPVLNEFNSVNEIDTGSCDRFNLLKNMLSGSYTENETMFGHYDSDRYFYMQNLVVKYYLKTDNEIFDIEHEGAFLNDLKTRIIILQKEFKGTN